MILRELAKRKEVEIIVAEACKDHIHMYVSLPPKMSVSGFVGYLKGKSTLIIFERHGNLKYKYGNRTYWRRGYYVSTVGNNKEAVCRYVENQLKEDMMTEQITIKNIRTLLRVMSNKDASESGVGGQTISLKR